MAHGESDVLTLMQQQHQQAQQAQAQQFVDPFIFFQEYSSNILQPHLEMDASLLAECEFDIADLEACDMLSALPVIEAPPKLALDGSYAMPTFCRPPPPPPLFVAEELNGLTLAKTSPPESPPAAEDSKDGILSWGELRPRRSLLMQRSMSSHALGQFPCSSSNSTSSSSSSTPSIPSSALDSAMQGLACSGSSLLPSTLPQLLDFRGDTMMHSLLDAKPTTSGSIRRVCSTGDIQRMNSDAQEAEVGLKIGRYNTAERKERIHRYRQKRSERNFNKKIKYACRKTLADSRPRVRGRFAKNEEVPDSSSSPFLSCSTGCGIAAAAAAGGLYGAASAAAPSASAATAAAAAGARTSHEYDEEASISHSHSLTSHCTRSVVPSFRFSLFFMHPRKLSIHSAQHSFFFFRSCCCYCCWAGPRFCSFVVLLNAATWILLEISACFFLVLFLHFLQHLVDDPAGISYSLRMHTAAFCSPFYTGRLPSFVKSSKLNP